MYITGKVLHTISASDAQSTIQTNHGALNNYFIVKRWQYKGTFELTQHTVMFHRLINLGVKERQQEWSNDFWRIFWSATARVDVNKRVFTIPLCNPYLQLNMHISRSSSSRDSILLPDSCNNYCNEPCNSASIAWSGQFLISCNLIKDKFARFYRLF